MRASPGSSIDSSPSPTAGLVTRAHAFAGVVAGVVVEAGDCYSQLLTVSPPYRYGNCTPETQQSTSDNSPR